MAEIDYSKRSFNYYPTGAIVYAKCIDGRWSKPVATNDFNLSLHCFAGIFHYAPSCFEGLKAYRGVDGRVRMFRPDENAKRMDSSARYLDPLAVKFIARRTAAIITAGNYGTMGFGVGARVGVAGVNTVIIFANKTALAGAALMFVAPFVSGGAAGKTGRHAGFPMDFVGDGVA